MVPAGWGSALRVLLGMIARSKGEPFLSDILSIVGGSFDAVEVLYDGGSPVADFAAARNRLIALGERSGFDWIMMLDADECMFPEDIASVRLLVEACEKSAIGLPRVEFANDSGHWLPECYPDYQVRAFRLHRGYRFRRRLHEQLYERTSPISVLKSGRFLRSDSTPIYHYGGTKRPGAYMAKVRQFEAVASGFKPEEDAATADNEGDDQTVLWPGAPTFEFGHPMDGNGVSEWTDVLCRLSTPREEFALLPEHGNFVQELYSRIAGLKSESVPLLGVGPTAARVARSLTRRPGFAPVVIASVEPDVSSAGSAGALEIVGLPPESTVDRTGSRPFALAYSIDLLHLYGDDQVRQLVQQQLELADVVLFSVPSSVNPLSRRGQGRYLGSSDWHQILEPVGVTRLRLYGSGPLGMYPRSVRQALASRILGAAGKDNADKLHVAGLVTHRR